MGDRRGALLIERTLMLYECSESYLQTDRALKGHLPSSLQQSQSLLQLLSIRVLSEHFASCARTDQEEMIWIGPTLQAFGSGLLLCMVPSPALDRSFSAMVGHLLIQRQGLEEHACGVCVYRETTQHTSVFVTTRERGTPGKMSL